MIALIRIVIVRIGSNVMRFEVTSENNNICRIASIGILLMAHDVKKGSLV